MSIFKPIALFDFVRLPLLLAMLTALMFYLWPQEIASGFSDMEQFIQSIARPATTTGTTIASQPPQRQQVVEPSREQPLQPPIAVMQWNGPQTAVEAPPEHRPKRASDQVERTTGLSAQDQCRKAQENYIDDPKQQNKSAMEQACAGQVLRP